MSRNLTAILADDEVHVLESLRLKLERHFPGIRVVACCSHGEEALEAVRQERPDLLFLDIEMPGMNGLALLQEIRNLDLAVQVIVVSAYEHPAYFRRAIHHAVASYLVKPVLQDELSEAIAVAMSRMSQAGGQAQSAGPYRVMEFPCVQGRVFYTEDQIVYVKAEGNYSRFFLATGKSELVLESMKWLESRFADSGIFRADRSHFINPRYVVKVMASARQCCFLESTGLAPAELNETGLRNVMRYFQ